MGEIADMVINGLLCQECGSYVDFEEPGYPRSCDDCEIESRFESLSNQVINVKTPTRQSGR